MAGHAIPAASSRPPDSYFFEGGRFEPRDGRLVHHGDEVRLRPKTAGVLLALLERPGHVVAKAELVDRVWGGAAGDEALAVCVAELRRALHEHPGSARLIGTVHRRGYRFLGAVATVPLDSAAAAGRVVIGRARESEVLAGWWRRSSCSERTIGVIAGEAGSGKTALLRSFLGEVRSREVVAVGEGRCAGQYGAEPYLPFLDVLEDLARGPNGSGFRDLMWDLAPTWLLQRPGMAPAEGLDQLRRRTTDLSSGRLLREAAELLDAFAVLVPTIVVIEDAHAANRATLELLAHLAERPASSRLLVIASYRPDDLDPGHPLVAVLRTLRGHQRCEHLELEPLTDDAVAELLRRRLAPMEPSPTLVGQVHARTEGNALFATALIERLVADDMLAEVEGAIVARAPLSDLGVPGAVRDLIAERVAKFDEAELGVLLAAAAAGVEFTSVEVATGALALALAEHADARASARIRTAGVESRLFRLAAGSGVLEEIEPLAPPGGSVSPRFRFRHELVRDALHGRLAGARAVVVHRAIGGLLEREPWLAAREPTATAEHFELGRDAARAAVHYARAADTARYRLAPREALELARRAASLATRPGVMLRADAMLALQVSLVAATVGVHGVAGAEVESAVREAESVADAMPDAASAGSARYLFWGIAFMAGDIRTAEARLGALERSAEGAADTELAMRVANARTVTSFAAGDPRAALRHAEGFRAIEEARARSGLPDAAQIELATLNRSATALASWLVGDPEGARRNAGDGLRIAATDGRPGIVCGALWPVVAVHHLLGERRAVRRYAGQLDRLAPSTEDAARWSLVSELFSGWARGTTDDPDPAREANPTGAQWIRACLDGLAADGMGFGRPYHLGIAADASLAVRDPRAALDAADEAIAVSGSLGDRWYAAELLRLRAESLLSVAATESPGAGDGLRRQAVRLLADAWTLAGDQGASALGRRIARTTHAAAERGAAESVPSRAGRP